MCALFWFRPSVNLKGVGVQINILIEMIVAHMESCHTKPSIGKLTNRPQAVTLSETFSLSRRYLPFMCLIPDTVIVVPNNKCLQAIRLL